MIDTASLVWDLLNKCMKNKWINDKLWCNHLHHELRRKRRYEKGTRVVTKKNFCSSYVTSLYFFLFFSYLPISNTNNTLNDSPKRINFANAWRDEFCGGAQLLILFAWKCGFVVDCNIWSNVKWKKIDRLMFSWSFYSLEIK